MKLYTNKADSFIKSPKGQAVLLYGNDKGLVREVQKKLTESFLPPPIDPMAVKEFSGDELKDDPALFLDEYSSTNFFVEKRVIIVDDPSNDFLESLGKAIERSNNDVLVIVTGGELGRESKVRKYFEDSKTLTALLCYKEEGMNLKRYIADKFRANGVNVDADALEFLTANLGEDKLITNSEIDKILLYLGDEKRLNFAAVKSILADNSDITLSDVSFAISTRNFAELEKSLARAYGEHINSVPIIRAILWHFQRLITVKRLIANGATMDEALANLRPAIFFRDADLFKLSLRKWTEEQLINAVMKLNQAELDAKSGNIDAELSCSHALLEITI